MLWFNKFIKFRSKSFYFKHWKEKGISFVHQFIDHCSIIPFAQLKLLYDLPDSFVEDYILISNALQSFFSSYPNVIQHFATSTLSPCNIIMHDHVPKAAFIYKKMCVTTSTRSKHQVELKWELDMDCTWVVEFWDKIWSKIFKTSKAARITQSLFFIYNRSVFTPLCISKFAPSSSPLCWSCSTSVGSLLHLLYSCPQVLPSWKSVWSKCMIIFKCDIPLNFRNIFLGSLSHYIQNVDIKPTLFDLFIALAFKVIMSCWKDASKLSLVTWWNFICDEHRIHTVTILSLHQKVKLDLYWLPFTNYLQSLSSSS